MKPIITEVRDTTGGLMCNGHITDALGGLDATDANEWGLEFQTYPGDEGRTVCVINGVQRTSVGFDNIPFGVLLKFRTFAETSTGLRIYSQWVLPENQAQGISRDKLRWTTEKPTMPGWYWCQTKSVSHGNVTTTAVIVEVYQTAYDNSLYLRIWSYDRWEDVPVALAEFQFAGPIPIPSE